MRVLSVTLWYHFAFMVLSTALFGFGFAGVVLSLRRNANRVTARQLALFACATPVAFAGGYSLFNVIPFEPFSLGRDGMQWLYLPLSYLAVTTPFFCSGLTIAALLTRHAREVHRLYLFDLMGAGVGSVVIIALLPVLGGTGTVFSACALASLGAAFVSFEAGKRWSLTAGFAAILFSCVSPFGDATMPVRISGNKITGDGVPYARVFRDPRHHKFTAWNTLSRVDVIEWRDRTRHVYRSILIDGGTAITRLARPMGIIADLGPANDDESFFYNLFTSPRAVVVGSGGGREVLLALRSGASHVDAVEINPAINELVSNHMADFAGRVYEDPRVAVFTDEARSFLGRSQDRYDVIHCPHTISNAALSSGSLSLAENYLLTLEAFEVYLSRLTQDGVLLITRPEAHLPRLFSTARVALSNQEVGALESRVMAWRRPANGLSFYAGFALSRVPFTEESVGAFVERIEARGLEPLRIPERTSREPYTSLVQGVAFESVPHTFDAILDPATDDRPFFNRQVPFSEIGVADVFEVFSRGTEGRVALEDRPVAESALLLLLAETVLIALVFIIVPLLVFRRRALDGAGRLQTLVAFFALGLAYITVEIGLIQKLTLYLGHPTVVYSTVLGTLLIASGLGSGLARRFFVPNSARRIVIATAGIVLVIAVLFSPVVRATLVWPVGLRVATAILLLAIPGLAMGMPFPLLVRGLERSYPERIPWAFGINGFASVTGTIAAVLIAMTVGQTAVLITGVLCYIAAAVAAPSGK